jgi:hypothetical protein
MDEAGRHLDDARLACSFNVAQYAKSAGIVHMVPEFVDRGASPA